MLACETDRTHAATVRHLDRSLPHGEQVNAEPECSFYVERQRTQERPSRFLADFAAIRLLRQKQ
jgi:hypothetical protein